jgi:thiamine pyrophosphokinase
VPVFSHDPSRLVPSSPVPSSPVPSSQGRPEQTVIVVTGGEAPDGALVTQALAWVPAGAVVVAADSGVEHALRLGLGIDHAVGDFDSVDLAVLDGVEMAGTRVVRHPVAKDATDLELALDTAVELGARRIVLIGGHGGRLDHLLGNALVLASPRFADLVVDAVMGEARVHVARPRGPTVVHGEAGSLVTLLPVHGPAEGVTTDGLLYPLDQESLAEGSTRGISNEMTGSEATVRLTAGCVLVVRPGGRGDHHTHLTDPPTTTTSPDPIREDS